MLFQRGAREALLETSERRAEQGESGCPVDNQGKVFQAEEIAHTKALRQEQAWCVKGRTRRLVWPGPGVRGKLQAEGAEVWGTVVRSCKILGDAVRLPAFYSEFYGRFEAES